MGWPLEANVAEVFQKFISAAIYGVLKKGVAIPSNPDLFSGGQIRR